MNKVLCGKLYHLMNEFMNTFIRRFSPIALLLISAASFATNVNQLPAYSRHYNEHADPFKDAVAALKLAKKTHRNVLIEVGGDWCTWCHRMDSFLAQNPKVYNALHQHYVLLKVSVSDANNNAKFMNSLPPVLGYPHMYVSTNNGKIIRSKDTAELQQHGDYSVANWLTFLAKWQNPSTQTQPNIHKSQGSSE